MRRALAALILGVSLWIGSLAWSGFIMTRTVLDPSRSERVADTLYENDAVRDRLAQNIATALGATIPDQVPVSDAELLAASKAALDSPAVRDEIVGAFVQTHRAFLGDGEAPEAVNAGAFGEAAREALVAARPDLDAVLPTAPTLRVPLPTERVPDLGGPRRAISAGVPLLALVSASGAFAALALTSNRPAILRRAGFWAIGLSSFVLLFAYGLPALAGALAPDQSEVVAALVGALAETTRGPALAAAALGAGAVVASLVWRAAPALGDMIDAGGGRSAPTAAATTAPPTTTAPPRRDVQWAQPPARARDAVRRPRPPDGPRPTTPGGVDAAQPSPTRTRPPTAASRTNHLPPTPTPSPAPAPSSAAPPGGHAAHWVDGVGWVVDPSATGIPEEARWVPGVGYVVEDPKK